MASEPSVTVSKLAVPQLLCPLVENAGKQGRRTHFANGEFIIWNGPDNVIPAAIPGNKTTILVEIEAKGGNIDPGTKLYVSAKWNQFQVPEPQESQLLYFIEPQKAQWSSTHLSCTINPVMINGNVQKRMPWAFKGPITWNFVIKGKTMTFTTNIELYVLPSYIPRYMIDNGLPLGLLRLDTLLPTWMKVTDPFNNNWPVFAVNAIFNDSRLAYDHFCGESTYCVDSVYSAENSRSKEKELWVELWLSDMNGLTTKPTSKLARYPINCRDTAGLVQCIASLNLEDKEARVRMIYLHEYGYIKPTHLIGRHKGTQSTYTDDDLCNNPFYKKVNTPMLVDDPKDARRRAFNCHFLVTISNSEKEAPKAFDACCGPHIGTEKLDEYIDNAIEPDRDLYAPNEFMLGERAVKRPIRASLEFAFDGPGVVSLATAASFTRDEPGIDPKANLFFLMETKLKKLGNILVPFEGSPSDSKSIVATWTFSPHDIPDAEAQISIWRHPTKEKLQQAYNRRRANLSTDGLIEAEPYEELTYEESEPGYYMFRRSTDDYHFLVVLEGTMSNKELGGLAAAIQTDVLYDNMSLQREFIEGLTVPETAQKVNTQFQITVKVREKLSPRNTYVPWSGGLLTTQCVARVRLTTRLGGEATKSKVPPG